MSIFNETIPEFIQGELTNRQNNISSTRNKGIYTETSKVAWVRMTSGVNTLKKDAVKKPLKDDNGVIIFGTPFNYEESDFDNTLAKNNVIASILGGNVNKPEPKVPLLDYNNKFNGTSNRHGIRPSPGITDLSCQSYSANGSLRKITIKFICWDISQLDVLEKLYMRPGYPLCIEWGWSHNLGDNTTLKGYPDFGKTFLNEGSSNLMDLHKKAYKDVTDSKGNFDIAIGKIQNYNYSARVDGGFDCETTIVTYGEILDSLKVNFIPFGSTLPEKGIFGSSTTTPTSSFTTSVINLSLPTANLTETNNKYAEGAIPGLCQELYNYMDNKDLHTVVKVEGLPITEDEINLFSLNLSPSISKDPNNTLASTKPDKNVYIQFASLLALLNYYVLPQNNKGNVTKFKWYDNTGKYFKCVAHPLQFPADPKVCIINPEGWIAGVATTANELEAEANKQNAQGIITADTLTESSLPYKLLNSISNSGNDSNDYFLQLVDQNNGTSFKEAVDNVFNNPKNGLLNYAKITFIPNNFTQYDFYSNPEHTGNIIYQYREIDTTGINYKEFLKSSGNNLANLFIDRTIQTNDFNNIAYKINFKNSNGRTNSNISKQEVYNTFNTVLNVSSPLSPAILNKNVPDAVRASTQAFTEAGLNNLTPFFTNDTYTSGWLPNIYINLDYVYKATKPTTTETDDKLKKNEISANKFMTDLLHEVQNSIGSINDFQIYGDHIDNTIQIIDKNYIEGLKDSTTKKIYAFEVDNTSSIVTAYTMKSQIFPEQTAQIAISAQIQSGQYGYKNQNLVDYNEGILSRILPTIRPGAVQNAPNVISPTEYSIGKAVSQIAAFNTNIYGIIFTPNTDSTSIVTTPSLNNNILRDLIAHWDGYNKSHEYSYSSPIPVVVSLSFLGIAGIKIGNLFDITGGNNTRILPASFKLKGRGVAFLVKSLSHSLNNNLWITTIEGYPFILPNKKVNDTNIKIVGKGTGAFPAPPTIQPSIMQQAIPGF
jgi:hypothetical protein